MKPDGAVTPCGSPSVQINVNGRMKKNYHFYLMIFIFIINQQGIVFIYLNFIFERL